MQGHDEALVVSLSERLGQFADRWWPFGLILFGIVFVLGIPTKS